MDIETYNLFFNHFLMPFNGANTFEVYQHDDHIVFLQEALVLIASPWTLWTVLYTIECKIHFTSS
jgi:hypothetical protein